MLKDKLSQLAAGPGLLQGHPSTSFNLSVRKVNLGYICHVENLYPDGTYVFPNKKDLMMGIELLIPDIDHE